MWIRSRFSRVLWPLFSQSGSSRGPVACHPHPTTSPLLTVLQALDKGLSLAPPLEQVKGISI